MPPPASLALNPAYERSLRAIVSQVQQTQKPLAGSGRSGPSPRSASRRSVEGKDFLQRLREAGL